jgi:hypothetical protein
MGRCPGAGPTSGPFIVPVDTRNSVWVPGAYLVEDSYARARNGQHIIYHSYIMVTMKDMTSGVLVAALVSMDAA